MKGKLRKIIKISLIAVLCLCALSGAAVAAVNAYVISYAEKYLLTTEETANHKFDCVLVLGAGLWEGKPSPMLKERLDFGLKVFKTGCTDRILMSGDHGQSDYDEVNAMKDYAIQSNVDSDCVFLDHAGFSTYESMYRARDIFNVEKMVIVTQKFHIYRAVYNARKLGIDAYGVPADKLKYPIKNDIRESLARAKDFIWCIFSPKPTYLGEAIPINGKAYLTDDRER